MSSAIHSRVLVGMTAHPVVIECHVSAGLPGTTIVGLPEGAVREARDRVRSAIKNSRFDYPDGRIVINLAPGNVAKSGPLLDLPIAMGVLTATRQLPATRVQGYEFLGELSLYGALRGVRGALACAMAAGRAGRRLVLPAANSADAALAPSLRLCLADSLAQVVAALRDEGASWTRPPAEGTPAPPAPSRLDKVLGQQAAKRALTVAAAGGHHVLMVGPPGAGKTLLAQGIGELLPPLEEAARLEVAAVYSAAGYSRGVSRAAPFRDPHHSSTGQALLGGGTPPRPGEVALAHHGVLFLDEVPHFKPSVLNLLREPIESGEVAIARASFTACYPCRFQLLAAMNPCPAGRTCEPDACRCTPQQVTGYQARLSGPLLDRIDLHVPVPALSEDVLTRLADDGHSRSATELRADVARARAVQLDRQGHLNSTLGTAALRAQIAEAGADAVSLKAAIARHRLSARSYQKVWRVARTIADLADSTTIGAAHLAEAFGYRAIDWEAGA